MSTTTEQSVSAKSGNREGSPMRKVLVVAYLFPPAGSVGVHRTLRFIKWLPRLGWEPVVLTTQNGRVHNLDESMLKQVPDVEVHRTYSFEALNYGQAINGTQQSPPSSFLGRVIREVPRDLWKLVAVPDDKIGWIPWAVREGSRILKSHAIDAIYVTGKPSSSYYVGQILGKRFGVPWIMDLRDLWTLNRRLHVRGLVRPFLERRLERRFVKSAAVVIANTPDNRRDFVDHYRDCDPDKFVVITNGYDRDDFNAVSREKHDKFTIAYSGAFYFFQRGKSTIYRRLMGLDRKNSDLFDTYSPKFFLQALRQLVREKPEIRQRLRVVLTGSGCDKARKVIEGYDLHDVARPLGWLSYSDSLEVLARSHVSLIVLSQGEESRGWIPSKLFQYLGAGTPVLAMVPDGDVKDIVLDTEAGTVVGPDDVCGAKKALWGMFQRYCEGGEQYRPNWAKLEVYEARQLTAKLAECLDRVSGRTGDR